MITAIDSSVLIDVLAADPDHGDASREGVRKALARGGLVACEVVWAEVAPRFGSVGALQGALGSLGVAFAQHDVETAASAGFAWRAYRRAGGARDHLLPDFLIGAHAQLRADRLLTRDRGFFRRYFPSLELFDPSSR